MVAEVYPISPALFAKAGPSCVSGSCPEGKMTCGKMQEVREEYRVLKEQAHA
jgi:thymidylate synthase (FAD)